MTRNKLVPVGYLMIFSQIEQENKDLQKLASVVCSVQSREMIVERMDRSPKFEYNSVYRCLGLSALIGKYASELNVN